MPFKYSLAFLISIFFWAAPQSKAHAPTSTPQSSSPASAPTMNNTAVDATTTPAPQTGTALDAIIDRIVNKEKELVTRLGEFTPMVETYIQNLTGDDKL